MNQEENTWVYCPIGSGYLHENGVISKRKRHFKENSVGLVKKSKEISVSSIKIKSLELEGDYAGRLEQEAAHLLSY